MKVLFNYYKRILKFNVLFSLVITFLGLIGTEHMIYGFFSVFVFSFFTAGYFLSLFLFELTASKQYYFYYNRGFSKVRLILVSYLLQLPVLVLFFVITKTVLP